MYIHTYTDFWFWFALRGVGGWFSAILLLLGFLFLSSLQRLPQLISFLLSSAAGGRPGWYTKFADLRLKSSVSQFTMFQSDDKAPPFGISIWAHTLNRKWHWQACDHKTTYGGLHTDRFSMFGSSKQQSSSSGPKGSLYRSECVLS